MSQNASMQRVALWNMTYNLYSNLINEANKSNLYNMSIE